MERREDGLYVRPRPEKLDANRVEKILLCGGTDTATAEQFGVSQVWVTKIRAGKAWRSVYDRVVLGKKVRLSKRHGLARNFEDCYTVDRESGCWLWNGAVDKGGYGCTFPNIPAHRESYRRNFGPIPDGMCVCHRCDVPLCVNPSHLFLGTYADNNADKTAKGRAARGSRNGASKLTEDQVKAIRRDARGNRSIARDYGVTPRVIRLIRSGETWGWLV